MKCKRHPFRINVKVFLTSKEIKLIKEREQEWGLSKSGFIQKLLEDLCKNEMHTH
jgi:hypothetical protein